MKGQLQYIADTLLVDQIFSYELGIKKQADASAMLGGISNFIKSWVSENVDTTSPTTVLTSVGKMMVPAVLFRIHPVLGVLYNISKAFGFDIGDIISSLWSNISPKLEQGQSISPDEINDMGKGMLVSDVGPVEASNDLFLTLRKQAQKIPNMPFLIPEKGSSFLERIFGGLSKAKGKWLLGAFAIWIVKTVLAGAGLLMVTDALKQKAAPVIQENIPNPFNSIKTDSNQHGQTITTELVTKNPPAQLSIQAPHKFKSSGDGEQYHQNSSDTIWIIPLVNNNLEDTLLNWCYNVYPETQNYDSEITESNGFKKTKSSLQKYVEKNHLIVPTNFHSRKEIVDTFVSDVESKINESK
jgi:outer membrane lipoprotein-sorting protein